MFDHDDFANKLNETIKAPTNKSDLQVDSFDIMEEISKSFHLKDELQNMTSDFKKPENILNTF